MTRPYRSRRLFGVLLSGWLADKSGEKGFRWRGAQKTPIICGLPISTCVMALTTLTIRCDYGIDGDIGNGFASITSSLILPLRRCG